MYKKQVLRKATEIISDNIHILHDEYKIGDICHSFSCLYGYPTTNTSDVSVRDTWQSLSAVYVVFIIFHAKTTLIIIIT